MTDEIRNEIALVRYAVIAPFVSGTYEEGASLNSFLLNASQKKYRDYKGDLVSFGYGTIERWYYKYRRDGFEGLVPKKRSDVGGSRKLDDDLKQQIRYFKKEYPRIPATLIYQKLFDNGSISKGDVSLATVTRYINQLKLEDATTANKDLKRYEHANVNQVWYADTSVGFSLTIDGKKKQKTYIICFIDDKSRYVTGADVFFNDNFENVMSVMRSAIMKSGKPRMFSFDNGKPYKNKQMDLLAARIGSVLNYTKPYTPTSKGKVERFFYTMKQQWLSQIKPSDFKSLDELSLSLKQYVYKYNTSPHSSLNLKTPKNVFFEDSGLIKFLSDEQIEKSFLLEHERRVSPDSVVKINNVEYEVPYRYAKQRIKLRYSPDLSDIYVVDSYSGDLEKIEILKKIDNARIKREPYQFSGGDQL